MPDVTDLLMNDHRAVEQLFAQFESTKDPEVAMQICDELDVHSKVEEELVYPVLAKVDPELEGHAEKEHGEAKELIAKIRAASAAELAPLVTSLKDAVQHHVQEEETKAFPRLKQQKAEEIQELAPKAEARKKELKAAGVSGGTTEGMTKAELYDKAKEADIEGRSKMTKEELAEAVEKAE